jgi:hypothetical protein
MERLMRWKNEEMRRTNIWKTPKPWWRGKWRKRNRILILWRKSHPSVG